MSNGYYEIFNGKNGLFYFRLKAPNHEIILSSQGYGAKQACQTGIESVRDHSPNDENYERMKRISPPYWHWFNLKARNGEVIGTSEMYGTPFARDKGIEAVKSYAPKAPVKDLT